MTRCASNSLAVSRFMPTGTLEQRATGTQDQGYAMGGDELSAQAIELVVPEEHSGARLDWYLAQQFSTYSRMLLRKVINATGVKVNGVRVKAAHRLQVGDRISVALPPLEREGPQPEDIPLDVLYEDPQIAVINKPPGMVVHPAKGHWSGTLTAA